MFRRKKKKEKTTITIWFDGKKPKTLTVTSWAKDSHFLYLNNVSKTHAICLESILEFVVTESGGSK